MYEVVSSSQKQTADDRVQAVALARRWSRKARGPVRVLRVGGGESMVYRQGSLQEALRQARPLRR